MNAILNALMRRPKDQAEGGGAIEDLLRDVVDPDVETTGLIELEVHEELYRPSVRLELPSLIGTMQPPDNMARR